MKLSVIKLEMMAIMAAFSLNMAAQKIVVLTRHRQGGVPLARYGGF